MLKNQKLNDVTFVVGREEVGRLDRCLAFRFRSWSRTALQKLINKRYVLVDQHPVSPHHRLRLGQKVSLRWPKEEPPKEDSAPVFLPFSILFEDEYFLVINKPPGIVVHPSAGHHEGNTVVELLKPRLDKGPWPEEIRPGLVHRLDRDTSGILVVAKTPQAHAHLSKQFARRQVKKIYLALVKGRVETLEGTLECYIGRHPGKRQRFAVLASGRWASTKFKILKRFKNVATLLELQPLTGRTHQIRVQLASYGHPILGDHVYGETDPALGFIKRQMLHAYRIQVLHPTSEENLEFEAPVPDDMIQSLKLIGLCT